MEKKKIVKGGKPSMKYELLLFKIEGHGTWRMTTAHEEANLIAQGTKFTDKRYVEIDKITGEIKEV